MTPANAVIYRLSVETYLDRTGDGIGDFAGPSPDKDNGYDMAEYYGVDPKYGSFGM